MATGNFTMKQVTISLAAVAVAAATAWALIATKDTPPKEQRPTVAPLVEVLRVQLQDVPVVIHGQGTVEAKYRAEIVPQVGGRVLSVHAGMISGGFVPAGEPLVVIDAADYELALRQAEAEQQGAQAALATAQAQIAEGEAKLRDARADLERMQRLNREGAANEREVAKFAVTEQVAASGLATAQAARSSAEARLAAANVAAEQARINLQRTRLTLPFDAVVINETVDAGQYIMAGQPIGEAYGAAAVEIPVPLEDSQLAWFSNIALTPGASASANGGDAPPLATAEVHTTFAGRECVWPGQVVRTEGRIDPATRMVNVVVEVRDPLSVTELGKPPLMPGAFVQVAIQGRPLPNVIAVPRHALRDGDKVWVVEDGQLAIREVEIARRDRQTIYISRGLEDGDVVITSPMDVVTEGMAVRTAAKMTNDHGPLENDE